MLSYEGDCIELFIDARKPESQGNKNFDKDVYQILLVPPVDNSSPPLVYVGQPKFAVLSGVVVNFSNDADGYSMEAKISLKSFPGLNMQNKPVIGFNIAVDDKDDAKNINRKSQIMWSPSNDASTNPSTFGKLTVK